jgi:hypothetical protein
MVGCQKRFVLTIHSYIHSGRSRQPKGAEAAAVPAFNLTDEQRKRLLGTGARIGMSQPIQCRLKLRRTDATEYEDANYLNTTRVPQVGEGFDVRTIPALQGRWSSNWTKFEVSRCWGKRFATGP